MSVILPLNGASDEKDLLHEINVSNIFILTLSKVVSVFMKAELQLNKKAHKKHNYLLFTICNLKILTPYANL